MGSDTRVRDLRTGKVYADIFDNVDSYMGLIVGTDRYLRIPKSQAELVGLNAVYEPPEIRNHPVIRFIRFIVSKLAGLFVREAEVEQ